MSIHFSLFLLSIRIFNQWENQIEFPRENETNESQDAAVDDEWVKIGKEKKPYEVNFLFRLHLHRYYP